MAAMPATPARAAPDTPLDLLGASDGTPFEPPLGWSLKTPPLHTPERIAFTFVDAEGDGRLVVVLTARGSRARTFAQTPSFDLHYEGRAREGDPAMALLDAVVAAIRRNDEGRLTLTVRGPPGGDNAASHAGLSARDRLQVAIAAGLLVLALLALPWLVWPRVRGALATRSPAERRATWGLLALGALIRLVSPHHLVMVFMGYQLTQQVIDFQAVPKYGAGSFVLYHAAIQLLGETHLSLVAVNATLGALTLPVLCALLARFRPAPRAVAIAAALLALAPVFVRDHLSESNLVPIALWLACALLLLDAWLCQGRQWDLLGAAIFAALALISRPEMMVVTPAALLLSTWARRPPRARWLGVALALAAVAALAGPHLLHVLESYASQREAGALPAIGWEDLPAAAVRVFTWDLVFRPLWFPIGVTLLALAALWRSRPSRTTTRGVLAVWLLALLWVGATTPDLPEPSIPRLHAPAASLVTLVGAAALAAAFGRLPRGARVTLAALVGLSTLPSAGLFAATNETQEEDFLAEAYARLPADACLVRFGYGDPPPAGKVHRHYPDYLAAGPEARVYGVRAWRTRSDPDGCPGGAWYLQSLRCYAAYRRTPETPAMLEACRQMRESATLHPVLELKLPNLGDNVFAYWPDLPVFEVGLYRLGGDDGELEVPAR